MSRLRVRSASGNWIDICQSDWFLRSDDNKRWIKLDVKKEMKVRHGANSYWLDIDCNVGDVDGLFCPTDDVIGCWPGLTGNFDPTLVGPGGPTGVMICDCSNRNCVSYDGDGPGAVFDGAVLKQPGFRNSHQNEKETAGYLGARKAPVTVYGGRAQVTEFYVDVGFLTGHVFAEWRGFGVRPRVRIYKNCKIVADNFMPGTTWEGNEGQMVVFSDLTTEETDDAYVDNPLLLVRVDAPANSNWEVKVSPANQNTIGHVLDPLPCFGTYDSDMACVFSAQERMHNMAGTGTTHFDYDVGNVPTRFRIFYRNGALLASTGNESSGYVVGRGSLSFNFTPLDGDYKILVRVDAKEAAAAWTYSLYCAGQKGSRKTPLDCCGGGVPANCDALFAHCPNPVVSNGADVTDFWVDFKSAPDGYVILPYTFQGDEPGQIIIYQNEKVIAASSLVRGEGYFDFEHNRARGTVIKIRVVTSCCTKWTLSPKCPVPYPTINSGDVTFDRCAPTEDSFGRMCFPITISHMIHKPVSVDYEVIAPDAAMGEECSDEPSGAIDPYKLLDFTGQLAGEDALKEWARTANEYYYADGKDTKKMVASAKKWTLNKLGHIETTANTAAKIALIAQPEFDDYSLSVTIGSNSSWDNDLVGVVAAFKRSSYVNNKGKTVYVNQHLVVYRQRGGYNADKGVIVGSSDLGFGVAYFENGKLIKKIAALRVGSATKGAWKGTYSRVSIDRQGTYYTVKCTDWNNDTDYLAESEYGFDVSGLLPDNMQTPCRIGFMAFSADDAWYKDFEFFVRSEVSVIPPQGATDLIKANTKGRAVIQPCETSTQVCVYTCPKTKKVDDRAITLILNNPKRGKIGKATAQGNMVCSRTLDCLKTGAVAVKEKDPNIHVKRGSYSMFVGNSDYAKGGFSTEMFAEIDIPADGEYTVYLMGDDYAELYIDCDLIVKSDWVPNSSMFKAFSKKVFLTRGKRFMRIYLENAGKNPPYVPPHPCYVAMAIESSSGKTVYASRAKDWRANVLFEGNSPKCNQFPETCSITPTGQAKVALAYNDTGIGYAAKRICSTHHDANCAPYNTFYVLERELDFPVSGQYTWVGTADDDHYLYIDCNLIGSGTNWETYYRHRFNVSAGKHRVTIMYRNIPNCTQSWVKFALLKPDNSVFYLSAPEGWGSIKGSISDMTGSPLIHSGENFGDLGALTRHGAQPIRTPWKPHYAWITAETTVNLPYDGDYTVLALADDQMELFISCFSIISNAKWSAHTRKTVTLSKGEQKLIVRAYNQDAGRNHFFAYAILDTAGNPVAVSKAGSHWKARNGDIDRTGIA